MPSVFEKLRASFEKLNDSCEPVTGICFNWTAKGVGFGQLYFYTKDDQVYCDNEMMGKEFIKKMLCKMVDDCVLTEPRE